MEYNIATLKEMLKTIERDIEIVQKFHSETAIQDLTLLTEERRNIAALIENGGVLDWNMIPPSLSDYCDIKESIHTPDLYIGGIYDQLNDTWHDEKPIKKYMLTQFLETEATTVDDIELATNMLISVNVYNSWWENLQCKNVKKLKKF
jgi:hypothetical protein